MGKFHLNRLFLVTGFLISFYNLPWRSTWLSNFEHKWGYVLIVFYLFRKTTSFFLGKGVLKGAELYALFIVFYYPASVALVTYLDWGQPLLYGVLTQQNFSQVFFPLVLLDSLMRGKIKISDVEKTLIFLSWAQLLFSISAYVLRWGWLISDAGIKGDILRSPSDLLFVGCYYYYARSMSEVLFRKKIFNIFFSLFFIATQIIIFKGRSTISCILAAWVIVFLIHSGSLIKKTTWIILATFFLLVLLPLAFLGGGGRLVPQIQNFVSASNEAIKVFKGRESLDSSANTRPESIRFMMANTRHWWFGNGQIYAKWRGNVRKTESPDFYTTDIGWYGIVYLYGLLGLIIANIQFIMGWRYRLPKDRIESREFFITCQGAALYYFFYSMFTMSMLALPAPPIFFLFVLWYMSQKHVEKKPIFFNTGIFK